MNQGQRNDYMDRYLTLGSLYVKADVYSVYKKSIIPYTQAWNLDFAEQIQSKLPRELRNMVFEYLLDNATLHRYDRSIRSTMAPSCTCVANGKECHCLEKRDLPHFLRPAYVGEQTGYEIVEMLYERYLCEGSIVIYEPYNFRRAMYDDNFKVKFNPSSAIRSVVVRCILDRYRQPRLDPRTKKMIPSPSSGLQNNSNGFAQLKASFTDMLSYQEKQGFDLELLLEQRNVRVCVLEEGMAAIQEVRSVFIEEGAYVDVRWSYMSPLDFRCRPQRVHPTYMYLQKEFVTMPRIESRAKVLGEWLQVWFVLPFYAKANYCQMYAAGHILSHNAHFLQETAEPSNNIPEGFDIDYEGNYVIEWFQDDSDENSGSGSSDEDSDTEL